MNATHHAPGDEALPADVGAEDPFDRIAGDDAETDDTATEPAAQRIAGRGGMAIEWSDEQLCAWVDRVVDHDERALAALYDATLSRVYGLVLRIVRRAALAEEVVEDTYFQVWRQAARFDASRGRVLTWLLGMARSRAIDALRHEARFQHETLDDEDGHPVVGDATTSDELLDVARGHAELHRALLLLNAQPRQLVALAFFRGLSHEEIASETALPLGTVKSQIRRALATLRLHIGEGGLRGLAS